MAELVRVRNCDDRARRGDVIFVHGLNGNPHDYWTPPGEPGKYWPAWIGEDVPEVGVWSLGYENAALKPRRFSIARRFLQGGFAMPLQDRANNVLLELETKSIGERPLAFVAHSMGGLIVKQLLRSANDSADPSRRAILEQTRLVCFIGTPHMGSDLAKWGCYFRTLLGTNVSMEDLRPHGPYLRDLNGWYRDSVSRRRGGIRTLSFYEMKPLPRIGMVVEPGDADPGVPDSGLHPLDEDHNTICRPRSKEAVIHRSVVNSIRRGLVPAEADAAGSAAIPAPEVRAQVDLICDSLARTENPDGGFKGVGPVRGMDDRSEEWTTAKNVYLLAARDPLKYRKKIQRAVEWLLARERRDGGWTDIGVSLAGGEKMACTVPTAWAVLALIEAERVLERATSDQGREAIRGAVEWLLRNQHDDGGWGGFARGSRPGSGTYPTAIVIYTLVKVLDLGPYRGDEQVDRAIRGAVLFLHNSRRELGWGHSPEVSKVQLPSTAIALSALLLAGERGFTAAVTPGLPEIAARWKADLEGNRLQRSDSIYFVQYTEPALGQIQVPFEWYPWTLAAGSLLGYPYGIKISYDYIKNVIVPNVDNLLPWETGNSAFALMLWLSRFKNNDNA
jgi:hypothetical protein